MHHPRIDNPKNLIHRRRDVARGDVIDGRAAGGADHGIRGSGGKGAPGVEFPGGEHGVGGVDGPATIFVGDGDVRVGR